KDLLSQGEGHNLAPAPRSLEPPSMVPGHDQEDSRNFPAIVVRILMQARAPSTRRLYVLKWRTFGRTHEDVASNLCYPSSKEAWIASFLLLHPRF
ncbi:hypothetical protein M9458_025767, partial [Cirrhinus mrigala]